MKKIKILFAIIAVVAMLSTVAFAAVDFAADTVEYTDGENLVISVYADAEVTFGKSRSLSLQYNDAVWEYVDFESALTGLAVEYIAGSEDLGDYALLEVVFNKSEVTSVKAGDKICDITFNKVAGEAIGTTFVIAPEDVLGNNLYTSTGTELEYNATITVKEAKQEFVSTKVDLGTKKATAGNITIDDTTYSGVAVVTAEVPAATKASVAGFEWVGAKDDADPTEFDVAAITGAGAVEFSAAVYGLPANFEVVANAYYWTAE